MEELTYEKALKYATDWARLAGVSYRYRNPDGSANCNYVHKTDLGPVSGCLVGAVLWLHGVPLAELGKHEGSEVRRVARHLVVHDELRITLQALDFLRFVQMFQDGGETWGKSIEIARQLVDDDMSSLITA